MSEHPSNQRVILGISASIAIYKSCELVRRLTKSGIDVRVCMTEVAASWINPLLFEALSGNKVITAESAGMPHIDVRDSACLMIVLPASADLIARAAVGMADDAVTATLLAFPGPRWIAPAMNPHMYNHPATIRNLDTLKRFGNTILETRNGEAICGDVGDGKLADIDFVFERITEFLSTPGSR